MAIALERFTISPSAIVAEVRLDGIDLEKSWVSIGDVRHDGTSMGEGMTSIEDEADDTRQIIVVPTGTDAPVGEWVLRIDEVIGFDAEGEQVRIAGPWEFPLSAP